MSAHCAPLTTRLAHCAARAAVGGTGLSILIGRPLVRLNFQQEAQEANFRWVAGRFCMAEGFSG